VARSGACASRTHSADAGRAGCAGRQMAGMTQSWLWLGAGGDALFAACELKPRRQYKFGFGANRVAPQPRS
jgi:hypothetical protein